jgi:GDP-L-fucose synthase
MRILLTGATGMLGTAIFNELSKTEHHVFAPKRKELDLLDYVAVQEYFQENSFEFVIHCAAEVAGIAGNIQHSSRMLRTNLRIDGNVFDAALKKDVKNLIYFGSSCMYPVVNDAHFKTEDLFKGYLEKTNEAYAISKLAGWKTAENVSREYGFLWKTFILSNLYGPNDHFEPERSHLLAAIINKVHWAIQDNSKSIVMWGDGSPKREFTYVEDVASFVTGSIHNFQSLPEIMNLGSGADYTVNDYYRFCFDVMGYNGDLEPDLSKPTGVKSKLMDSSIATSLGWSSPTTIHEGIRLTYDWFCRSENGGINV